LYFKRIDLHGFKSFADPVSIEFNDGITCIVGPNGSGKSNISDAIRWVLGEQSPKTLRGGKMEEVIFAGTANRKSRGMAEVTLVIDNKSGILPIAFNEVAITRKMYRSGESEYSINNSPCRLRDIRELIMDTGIGVDGYSLIGQGKISDIVSNKPESRRQIFEEAAGIVLYRSKKADTEKKLETSLSNLERVNDIIDEIESRIDSLRQDREKATEYISLKERYKALEINITLKNIEGLELKNEYLIDDILETESNLEDSKEERAGFDQQLVTSREKVEALEKPGNETRDRLLKCVEEINALVNKGQLSEEKLGSIEKNEIRLRDEIASYQEKIEKERGNEKELLHAGQEIESRLHALKDDLKEKAQSYSQMTGALEAKAAEIDQKKNDLFALQNLISAKSSEAGSLASLKNTLEKRKIQLLSEKQHSENMENETRASLAIIRGEIDRIKAELEGLAQKKQELKTNSSESMIKEKQIAREMEELRISISKLSSRKKTIEEMESNYEGYNSAVRFIMKSQIRGIQGVVAELIKVPEGYETAIETALGAALQNIVCIDDASAQNAISILKENKAGRLTFLPISSIKAGGNKDGRLKTAQGFKGYGVDCITFDSQYRNIMEYLLGRVIIVDRLSDAIALSKSTSGGLRFVTLEGEIINAGGAITGGAYKNRTANLLERRSEIAKLGQRIDEMKEDSTSGEAQLEVLRSFIETMAARAASIDEKHRTTELEAVKKENEINAAVSLLRDFELRVSKWDRELGQIEEEQQSSGRMIEQSQREVETAKENIAAIEKTVNMALSEYDDLKLATEKVNEEITGARISVSSCESEKGNTDLIILRIKDSIEEMSQECKKREEDLESILSEREAILSGSAGSADDLKEKEEEKNSIEKYLAELTEERAVAVSVLSESTQAKNALDEKINMLLTQKYELEIKKTKNEAQLDGYKDKLWEEFEISYIQAIEFAKKEFAMAAAVKESREIKARLKELGEVNVGAIKEYETVSERYTFLTGQRADILGAMGTLKQIILDMDKTIREKFKESFNQVVVHFEEIFKELFGGGVAQLRLEDESKPLESGIEIIAQPPGKKLQNINLMSGGEKTMTAIALMFAVLRTKPTPFCILDEIEAALDDANIERFGSYLKNFDGIQFALVTHQKATMEYANVLYGVTMPEQGISKIISLKLEDQGKENDHGF